MSKVLAYNLRKPYKMVVSAEGSLIIQNGMVYETGSGRVLGPVATMLKGENKDILYCKFSGATFPNTEAGKEALAAYQEKRGYIDKESDGTVHEVNSTLEDRKAEISARRDKINHSKHKG